MRIQETQIIRPPRLKPGDTIGIAAPASHFDRDAFDRGVDILEGWGFRINIPEEIFDQQGYLAGSDKGRADTINRLFADPEVQAVMCARGGFGAIRSLEFIDFDAVSKAPKIFMGFSDATVLLTAFSSRCRLATLHGPTVTTLAGADERTCQALFEAVSSDRPVRMAPEQNRVALPGQAFGPVVGGNLTTLCHLIGTGFFPEMAGKILLLEDRGEAPYRIDRMLSQMKLAGCFDGMAGVALGAFHDCGEDRDVDRVFTDAFGNLGIPVLGGFPIGHGKENLAVPIGLSASLDTTQRVLTFRQPATV
jgi:muramoyltetrapeptide carboxypeptidase